MPPAQAHGAPQQDAKSTVQQGYIEKSNVNSVVEMSRMVEIMRTYTNIANMLPAAERPAQIRDREARRRSGLSVIEEY